MWVFRLIYFEGWVLAWFMPSAPRISFEIENLMFETQSPDSWYLIPN
jgi:hypothetical protein